MSEYKLPLLNEEGFFMVYYHKQGCSVSDFLNRVMLVNTSPDMGDKPPNFQKPDSLHLPCIIFLHVYIKPVYLSCGAQLSSTQIYVCYIQIYLFLLILDLKGRHWQTDSLTSMELSTEIRESQVCHLTKQQTDGA